MFERLEPVVADDILTLMAAYRADPDPHKVDLGIGVYRDERGETPVLASVRRAEELVLQAQTTDLTAQDNLAQSQAALTADLVAVYKALGGGWKDDSAGEALPREADVLFEQ